MIIESSFRKCDGKCAGNRFPFQKIEFLLGYRTTVTFLLYVLLFFLLMQNFFFSPSHHLSNNIFQLNLLKIQHSCKSAIHTNRSFDYISSSNARWLIVVDVKGSGLFECGFDSIHLQTKTFQNYPFLERNYCSNIDFVWILSHSASILKSILLHIAPAFTVYTLNEAGTMSYESERKTQT